MGSNSGWKCGLLIFFLLSVFVNDSFAQYLTKKEKAGKWGLFDGKKKVVDFTYDEIDTNSLLFNGYFLVRKGDQYGVLNEEGLLLVPCEYDTVKHSGKDRFIVAVKDKYGLYLPQTGEAPELIYEDIQYLNPEGNGVVKLDGNWVNLENGEVSADQERVVFTTPEKFGRFPGCEDLGLPYKETKKCAEKKMLEHIYRNIKYPKTAVENGVEGMIVISFLISPEGKITAPKVVRTIGGGCDEAGLEVLNSMPDWIPAEHDGEKVWMQFNLPIRFKLQDGNGKKKKRKN